MYETAEDIEQLQALLDESYEKAGSHLLSIHTDNWRMSAQQIAETLTGMCVLNFATVNSRGEPIQGPVDGQFYRGRFYCGSARNSMRARHIKARPAVSVAHVRGEELAVVAHGTAPRGRGRVGARARVPGIPRRDLRQRNGGVAGGRGRVLGDRGAPHVRAGAAGLSI